MDFLDGEQVEVTRYEVGKVNASGRRHRTVSSVFPIWCDAQPVNDQMVLSLGLDRTFRWYSVLTGTKLQPLDERTKQPPDRVEIDGEQYEVFQEWDFNRQGLAADVAHYRYLVGRRPRV